MAEDDPPLEERNLSYSGAIADPAELLPPCFHQLMPVLNSLALTKRVVDGLPLPPAAANGKVGNRFVWDDDIRGFGVRVFSTGARVFVYQCRVDGRTVRLKLGTYPSITVEEARKLAKQAAGAQAAGKPLRTKVSPDEAHAVSARFPDFLDEIEGKLAPRTQAEYRRLWEKHIRTHFGRKALHTIDSVQVARWHSEGRATKRQADNMLNLLSKFFTWSEQRGYRPEHSNPCAKVERFEKRSDRTQKGRSLTADEYRALGATLDVAATTGLRPAPKQQKHTKNDLSRKHRPKMADAPKVQSPVILAALRFLALSGWRKTEALSLQWDAIDFGRGMVTLQFTKTDRSVRPLGKVALDLLKSQPRRGANPYVFPGLRAGSPLAEPKYAWTSIRHAAGITHRLHDLRHSFTTVASDDLGMHDRFIAGLIGHRLGGTTARYGEVREGTLRHKADEIAGMIDGYMRAKDAKVLPFASSAAKAS
jgi:integrase